MWEATGTIALLETAIRSVTTTPLLGHLPTDPAIAIPERHLGLHTTEETTSAENRLAAFAQAGQQHLDIAPLLDLSWPDAAAESEAIPVPHPEQARVRIGVARDKAFSFYYEDNFDLLRENGAEIVAFSPLSDAGLPQNLDGLYLGGGYPELYADAIEPQYLDEHRNSCVRGVRQAGVCRVRRHDLSGPGSDNARWAQSTPWLECFRWSSK